MIRFLLLLLFTSCVTSDTNATDGIFYCENCNILLGALAPIHFSNTNESRPEKCTNIFRSHALPRAEAMLFAVDKINNDSKLLNGTKLGIQILDTCGIGTAGTEMAKVFVEIRGVSDTREKKLPYFAGVVGAMYSSVSIDVATFLRPWLVPQISPASTSVKLSDKRRFPFFARTVPSNTYQSRIIVDVLERLNWTLVSTIVSDNFGVEWIKDFEQRAGKKGICNYFSAVLPANPTDNDFMEIMCKILVRTDTNVVVLLTSDQDTKRILEAKSRLRHSSPGTHK